VVLLIIPVIFQHQVLVRGNSKLFPASQSPLGILFISIVWPDRKLSLSSPAGAIDVDSGSDTDQSWIVNWTWAKYSIAEIVMLSVAGTVAMFQCIFFVCAFHVSMTIFQDFTRDLLAKFCLQPPAPPVSLAPETDGIGVSTIIFRKDLLLPLLSIFYGPFY
jgi:hypothetical protein